MSIRFCAWHYPPHRRKKQDEPPHKHCLFVGFDHWWEVLYLKWHGYHKHQTLVGMTMIKFFAKELKGKSYGEIMKMRWVN